LIGEVDQHWLTCIHGSFDLFDRAGLGEGGESMADPTTGVLAYKILVNWRPEQEAEEAAPLGVVALLEADVPRTVDDCSSHGGLSFQEGMARRSA
jgi:hypothetical protein